MAKIILFPKPSDDFNKKCGGKVKYISETDAQKQLHNLQNRRRRGWKRLEIYICNHCGYMHIGHRPVPRDISIEQALDYLLAAW